MAEGNARTAVLATSGSEVVVVGAGISGLTAARELHRAGVPIIVVEARDRVGGKMHTVDVGADPVDLGAHWISPDQKRIGALIREFGLITEPQYQEGRAVMIFDGRRSAARGSIPRLPVKVLLDMQIAIWRLESMRKRLLPESGWSASATEWDTMTLGEWARRHVRYRQTRDFLALVTKLTFGAELDSVSLLFFLNYLQQAGGFSSVTGFEGGMQDSRVVGGTQQICLKLADELGDRVVLNAPVHEIRRDDDGVTVATEAGHFTARRVIVAMGPAMSAQLRYSPPLPPDRVALTQETFSGGYMKAIATYERPWWRDRGLSGLAMQDSGPVQMVVDASGHSGQGTLMAFVTGRAALDMAALSADERRKKVLDALSALVGPEAGRPCLYLERNWNEEPYSRGQSGGLNGPGTMTRVGGALSRPIGRIHWAGAETAREWIGSMEGGIEAGQRAAAEVLAAL